MRRIESVSDPSVIWDRFPTYSGDLAFDVGANAGMVAAILAGGFKKVVAYEPNPDSFEALSELGPPILPVQLAISDHSGTVTLGRAERTDGMGEYVTGDTLEFSWGRPTGTVEVGASTLDEQMEVHGVPDFVKIDTEGHEVRVVAGGTRLFSQHHPQVLIEVHAAENGALLRGLLYDYDLTHISHPGYPLGSYERDNHFFLVSA